MKFEHRGRELTILNAFTYSKAIDNVGQVLETTNGGSPNPQDIRNPLNDRGPSSFDQRFNNTTSLVYEMPFGKGRRFGKDMPGAVDVLVGGWQASSVVSLLSGQPLNLRYPDASGILSDGQPDFLGNVALRPNYLGGDVKSNVTQDRHLAYFNRAAVAIPTVTSPFGTLGRNTFRAPGFATVDFGLSKGFTLKERLTTTFRFEAFNVLNRTNLGAPNAAQNSVQFMRITGAADPRILQLALRMTF